jgi:hypothetical protein
MALSLHSVDVEEFDLGNARLIILRFVPLIYARLPADVNVLSAMFFSHLRSAETIGGLVTGLRKERRITRQANGLNIYNNFRIFFYFVFLLSTSTPNEVQRFPPQPIFLQACSSKYEGDLVR